MAYCLVSVCNVFLVGGVSYFCCGFRGLIFAALFAAVVFMLPLCPFADELIAAWFHLRSEVDSMSYFEKTVYVSFFIYIVALRFMAAVVALALLLYAVIAIGISIVSGSGWTVADAVSLCANGYKTVVRKGNELIDSIIGTFIDILDYIRRKRHGVNVANPEQRDTAWVKKKEEKK